MAPGVERVVQATGHAGIPTTGVSSVFVNVTALDVAATTTLRVWANGAPAPALPTLTALKGDTVTNLIDVPVSAAGRLLVRDGAAATDVVLDVSGYGLTPTAAGASRNGMVTEVAPTILLDTRTATATPKARLGAGKFLDAQVTGKAGVPAVGASAVMLDLSAFSPTVVTGLTVYAPGTLPGTQNLSVLPGTSRTNLVLVPVGASGKVRIENQHGTVDVKLDVVGWVSNGTIDVSADSANPESAELLVDTSTGVGAPKAKLAKGLDLTINVAGHAGVPANGSTTPAMGALLYVGLSTTASAYLSVGPAGVTPSSVANVVGRAGQVMANTVFVPLSSDGRIVIHNSAASAVSIDVRVEVIAWLGGSVLLDPQTRVLDAATTTAITDLTDTTVTFSTATGSAASLHVGNVIVAPETDTTPQGLLRIVTAVVPSTGSVMLSTTTAGIADAIRNGDFTSGPPPTTPPALPGAAHPRTPATAHSLLSAGVSVSQSFSEDLLGGGESSGSVTASGEFAASLTASLDVHIHYWSLSAEVDLNAAASESFDASLDANYTGSWSHDWTVIPEDDFGTYDIQIGPIPIVVTPFAKFDVHATGSVSGTASMGIHQSFGASVGMKITGSGVAPTHTLDDPAPTFSGPSVSASATAKISGDPTIGLRFDGVGEASLKLEPYLELKAATCNVSLHAGLDLGFEVGLEIEHVGSVDYSPTPVNLGDATLATVDIPGACTHWTGTVSWHGTMTQAVNNIHSTVDGSLQANGSQPSILTESSVFTGNIDCPDQPTDTITVTVNGAAGVFDPQIFWQSNPDGWRTDTWYLASDFTPNFPGTVASDAGCTPSTTARYGIDPATGFNVANAIDDALLHNTAPDGSLTLMGTFVDTDDVGGDGGTLTITYNLTRVPPG